MSPGSSAPKLLPASIGTRSLTSSFRRVNKDNNHENHTHGPLSAVAEPVMVGGHLFGVRVMLTCPLLILDKIFDVSGYDGSGEAEVRLSVSYGPTAE